MTDPDTTGLARLIVYACPAGELAAQCDQFWAFAQGVGSTTAQTYPPHVSLTGFFRRPPSRVGSLVDEIEAALAATPDPPVVEVVALRYQPLGPGGGLWLGLEVSSPYLTAMVAELVAGNDPGDHDELRPKNWLHLSLAYGLVDDLDVYHQRAQALVDPEAAADWDVGLWERTADGGWLRHSACRLV